MVWTLGPIAGSSRRLSSELARGKTNLSSTWEDEEAKFSTDTWSDDAKKIHAAASNVIIILL